VKTLIAAAIVAFSHCVLGAQGSVEIRPELERSAKLIKAAGININP
jgi:hypothetical protein